MMSEVSGRRDPEKNSRNRDRDRRCDEQDLDPQHAARKSRRTRRRSGDRRHPRPQAAARFVDEELRVGEVDD